MRPQARRDLQAEVRYYRITAGEATATKLATAHHNAVITLQQQPGIGSPRLAELLEIDGLRSWRLDGFPLVWFYFERSDHLDLTRLLGERQDILSILRDQ